MASHQCHPPAAPSGYGLARGTKRSTTYRTSPSLPWTNSRPSPQGVMSFSTTRERRVTIFGPRMPAVVHLGELQGTGQRHRGRRFADRHGVAELVELGDARVEGESS